MVSRKEKRDFAIKLAKEGYPLHEIIREYDKKFGTHYSARAGRMY